jgi:hypothetical protein
MLDRGQRALRHVRIERDLRRRRNGNGNRDAGDGGNGGNVNIVRNVGSFRNGNIGLVGDVRFRLEQHGFSANVNVAHNVGRRGSNRNSVGIYRDRQSWGQFRSGGTDGQRSAHRGYARVGPNDAHCFNFNCDGKPDRDYSVHYSWK